MASRMRSANSWQNDRYEEPSFPPPQFSIRGSSGPYWLLISNLMKGTSAEDIRMTFEPFGAILEVKLRPPPTTNHPSSSFEIAFESRLEAQRAREQFNGALADGRVLSVDFLPPANTPAGVAFGTGAVAAAPAPAAPQHTHNPTGTTQSSVPYAQFSRSVSQAAQDRKTGPHGEMVPGPAPLARETRPLPTGPAGHGGGGGGGGGGGQGHGGQGGQGRRDLIPGGRAAPPPSGPRAVSGQKRKASGGGGPSNVAASAPTPAKERSLQSRLMGPADQRRVQKAQVAAKKAAPANTMGALGSAARRSGGAIPTGPKGGVLSAVMAPAAGSGKGAKGGSAPLSLKDRIGSLPLAQRLAVADSKANKGPKSAVTQATPSQKKRKPKKKAGANGDVSMDLN
ncbi:hypothetical protein CF319_g4802 [Tilletia indica]|nr:hypothetical protein CF319_g4802 [Tilletia indica]